MSYYDTNIGDYGGMMPSPYGPDQGNTGTIAPSYPIATPPVSGPGTPAIAPGTTAIGTPAADSPVFSGDITPSGFGGFGTGSSILSSLGALFPSIFGGGTGAGGDPNADPLGTLGSLPDLSGLVDSKFNTGGSGGFGNLAGGVGSGLTLLSSLFNALGGHANTSSQGILGSTISDAGAGATLGTEIFPGWGTAIGAVLGAMLGLIPGLTEGGLPKMAKPQGFVNALEGSGNPLESMLGQYIQKYGINRGTDLSAPNQQLQPTAMANVLEFLSGTQLPYLGNNDILTPPGQAGYKNPVGLAVRRLPELQGLLPNSSNLSLAQIHSILPEITNIIEQRWRNGGNTLKGLLQNENALAAKLQAAETY